jgi:hypothetical protein
MFHRWAALALVLALCAFAPKPAAGQQKEPPRGRKSGVLGQNTPNPFGAETTIPFVVGDDSCSESRLHVVSIRIYNILSQLVAIPRLLVSSPSGDSAAVAEARPEQPVRNLHLACGSYEARWDGKDRESGHDVAPGIYVYELNVDGDRQVKKMVVAR